jgi:hypothetical protein
VSALLYLSSRICAVSEESSVLFLFLCQEDKSQRLFLYAVTVLSLLLSVKLKNPLYKGFFKVNFVLYTPTQWKGPQLLQIGCYFAPPRS